MKKFNGKKIMAVVTALGICAAPLSASAADGCFAKQMIENMLKNREIPCISDIVSASGEGANGEKYEILSEKLKDAASELGSYIKCGNAEGIRDCLKQLLNFESNTDNGNCDDGNCNGNDNGNCDQNCTSPEQEQKPEQQPETPEVEETPVIPEIPTETPDEKPQDTPEKDEIEDLPTVEVPTDKPDTPVPAPTPDENPEQNPSDKETSGAQTMPSGYAYEIVSLVNQHRTAAGLSPLKYDDSSLMAAAQKRAEEQQTLYSHTRPDGSSCFTVLDQFGISYFGAGENIAMGQRSAAEVVEDWMNSEGHRENIMNPAFTHIGVGVHQGGGRYYWSQMFIAKR